MIELGFVSLTSQLPQKKCQEGKADNKNLKERKLRQFPEYISGVTVRADSSWTANAERQAGITGKQCALETSHTDLET